MRALFFILFSLWASSVEALSHCVIWHHVVGEQTAISGAFISKITTDDPSYNSISLLSGSGDNHQFAIAGGNELRVGGSALSAGSYEVTLRLSNGSSTRLHTSTITVVPRVSHPRIAAGFHHTLILNDQGMVYSTGGNDSGQLGIGSTANYRTSPTLVNASYYGNEEVVAVRAGSYSSALLTRSGHVYVAGRNQNRSLGLGDAANRNQFTQVTTTIGAKNVVDTHVGFSNLYFLTDEGLLYATGQNITLGLGVTSSDSSTPQLVPNTTGDLSGDFLIALGGGRDFSTLLAADGKMYGHGKNSAGQLGLGNYTSDITTPTQITTNVTKIFGSSGFVNYLIKSDGLVYVTGDGNFGALGTGSTADRNTLAALPSSSFGNLTPYKVSAGSFEVYGATPDANLYGFGRNSNFQISSLSGNRTTPTLDTRYPLGGAVDVAVGASFSVIITSFGDLKSVGTNSVGELGTGNTTSQSNFQDMTIVASSNNVALIDPIMPSTTELVAISSFNVTWNSYELDGFDEL